MTRKSLRSVCLALVGVLLFAQMAIASYACPALSSMTSLEMQSSGTTYVDSGDAMLPSASNQGINCEDMAVGMAAPTANLCAEHCHFGQQSSDTPTITVPLAMLTTLYVMPLAPEPVSSLRRPTLGASSALVAASPPHAILHCCFRI